MEEIRSMHKIGLRLLKMIHSVDSAILPLHLLEVCLSVLQIYAGLFLTAGMIDRLLMGAYGQAAKWAICLLLAHLFFGVTFSLMKRRFRGIWKPMRS